MESLQIADRPQQLFIRHLKLLEQQLLLIQQLDNSDEQLLNTSLYDSTFDLKTQVHICANFALRACCPLWQVEKPNFENEPASYQSLLMELQSTIGFLNDLDDLPRQAWQLRVSETAGFAELELSAEAFLFEYALPNFMFHYTMVYTTAKANGVDLGKADFDGYHQYPKGFSFSY